MMTLEDARVIVEHFDMGLPKDYGQYDPEYLEKSRLWLQVMRQSPRATERAKLANEQWVMALTTVQRHLPVPWAPWWKRPWTDNPFGCYMVNGWARAMHEDIMVRGAFP